ncbi:MAG: DMT family transporter [Gaiellaceae bacterium]
MGGILALTAGACWGIGDFLGGLSAKRVHVLTVLLVSQALGAVGIAVWTGVAGEPFPGFVEVAPAVGAGVAGLVGLGALYRGLSIGAMGIVAPISAAAPVIPLGADFIRGDTPSAVQWAGVALVLTGVAVVSREPTHGERRFAVGVGLAVLAALGFGCFYVALDAAATASVPWAVLVARWTGVAVVLAAALAVAAPVRPPAALLPALVGVALFDTSANVLLATATTKAAAGIVAVLTSVYPLVTIVLARLVLGEQLSASRRVGGVIALSGAALVAAG